MTDSESLVFVVDDDDSMKRALARLMRSVGLNVETFGSADEFLARLNRIRSFVPEHNLTSGTANEMLLRNFLSEYSSGKFALGQGFICEPTIPDRATHHLVSKQCDIIIYDRDYQLVHSEGEVKVVWPQAVRMVIEVKTKL